MKLRIIVLCVGIVMSMFLIAVGKNAKAFKNTATVKDGLAFKHGAWLKILKMAEIENKLIFLDCYTSWSGPCKMLAKTVFKDPKISVLMNNKFINVKKDMEKGEGVILRKMYGIKSYPTLLFINSNGEVKFRIVGICSSDEFVKNANKALLDKWTDISAGF